MPINIVKDYEKITKLLLKITSRKHVFGRIGYFYFRNWDSVRDISIVIVEKQMTTSQKMTLKVVHVKGFSFPFF